MEEDPETGVGQTVRGKVPGWMAGGPREGQTRPGGETENLTAEQTDSRSEGWMGLRGAATKNPDKG